MPVPPRGRSEWAQPKPLLKDHQRPAAVGPGRYLALLEMKLAMATLLGRFDIASVDTPDGQEARERLSFTMMPVGLRMKLRERR